MRRTLFPLIVGSILALLSTGVASAAPSAPAGYRGALDVINRSNVYSVGIIHVGDGSYAAPGGNYDAKLPPQASAQYRFGWPHTAGIWVASGYRVRIYNHNGTDPSNYITTAGPGWFFFNNPVETYYLVTVAVP